jgi:hypothetical protein
MGLRCWRLLGRPWSLDWGLFVVAIKPGCLPRSRWRFGDPSALSKPSERLLARRNMSPLPLFCGCVKLTTMTCPEKIRLQQLYEATHKRWAQMHESSQTSGENTWLVQEVLRRALNERDAAKDRLKAHQRSCQTCRIRLVYAGHKQAM